MRFLYAIPLLCAAAWLLSCERPREMTLAQLEGFRPAGAAELIARTEFRPFHGYDAGFAAGEPGGVWNASMVSEPRTFNHLAAEGDGSSMSILDQTLDYLAAWDSVAGEWRPRLATWEIAADYVAGTLDIVFTLREGLYWTYHGSDRRVPLTSGDFVFWHNEIVGDPRFHSSGFSGQWVAMPDGSAAQRRAYEVCDRRFGIHFPRIVANPVFASNMQPAPRHHFEPALREGGPEAVRGLFNISADPRGVPSVGRWHVTEYSPGQRLVFERNPGFWERDAGGASVAYPERMVMRILPDQTTRLLLFMQGSLDSYALRAEDMGAVLGHPSPGWAVYHNDGAMGSGNLWTFNQNTANLGEPWQEWFSEAAFRQAMSSMLNRDRIISQVFRGLAQPMLWWFPPANEFYNPGIRLRWTYDPGRALELLASIGMERDAQGAMRDRGGRRVEFDISFPAGAGQWDDMASIIADELAGIGITANPVPTDFQRLVGQLMDTFDWQTVMIGLGGGSPFPTMGTNVWLSNGNLHMWHPFQETPYREWEARKDWLFREGMFTHDPELARPIWDEFQELMLYQMPLIYFVRPHGFAAVSNRWDLSNFFFDNSGGARTSHLFLYR